ncbi:Major Facilitator Superfamily protein [Trichomonas vaginalis G3]|uniref:Lysosomal dipeptide transporter MFSD1 n=1 Tax=Trichomonas vaginalis (strain ATCC PRA-98 / G3) TaxID=412133 RepID=A2EY29_TRIV3|nr:major facilitator superfamily transporter [Trichomonas vaginalis G3]EAY02439.1 Major Facilitator Superfamily protein [Trichomonas vaginalis G3]KAI5527866.1 Major Facilitator Superfamily [Trichomonas vaginalis G3]|eukprot:XP_001330679.1 major facilitator superfamily transporter [Trichomonas vaginalis G3]
MSDINSLLSGDMETDNPNLARPCMYQFRKWSSIFFGAFSYIFVYFHRFSTAVLADEMAKDFNVPKDKIGILASMYFWPYGLIQPFIGSLADIVEPGYMIGCANLISAIGTLICSFSPNLTVCCVGRLLVGLGCSSIFVPTNKIGANWFSSREFRFFSGCMIGVGGVGSLLSQYPLSLLGHAIGWRTCLRGTAILGFILSIIAFLLVRGHPAKFGFRGHTPLMPTPGFTTIFVQLFQNIGKMIKIGNFWLLALYMFFAPGVFMVVSSLWGVPYLENIIHLSHNSASFLQMSISCSLIIGSPTIPIIAEFTGSRKWTLFGVCGMAAACCTYLALYGQNSPVWAIALLYFLSGYGASANQGCALALFKEFADDSLAATLVGGGNTPPFIGGAILQILSSAIIGTFDHTQTNYPVEAYALGLWGLSAICCFLAMFFVLFLREPKIQK